MPVGRVTTTAVHKLAAKDPELKAAAKKYLKDMLTLDEFYTVLYAAFSRAIKQVRS